jgi:hypothetical protein
MTNTETIKAIDAEIKIQEAELQRLREEKAAIVQEENHVNKLFDAVLNCPHSITHESVTLHFYPRQKEGHNALAQLHHRLAAYDQEARQREMQLLSEIEALERLALGGVAPNVALYDPREVAFNAPQAAIEDRNVERLQSLLCRMIDQLERRSKFRSGNAPGHSHGIPGIWDSDNGELAGKKCAWCEVWREALEVYAAAQDK